MTESIHFTGKSNGGDGISVLQYLLLALTESIPMFSTKLRVICVTRQRV